MSKYYIVCITPCFIICSWVKHVFHGLNNTVHHLFRWYNLKYRGDVVNPAFLSNKDQLRTIPPILSRGLLPNHTSALQLFRAIPVAQTRAFWPPDREMPRAPMGTWSPPERAGCLCGNSGAIFMIQWEVLKSGFLDVIKGVLSGWNYNKMRTGTINRFKQVMWNELKWWRKQVQLIDLRENWNPNPYI